MKVLFYSVRKYGVKGGSRIHASVDGHFVMWDPKTGGGGWRCAGCGFDADLTYCPHIDAIEELLHPSVLEGWLAGEVT